MLNISDIDPTTCDLSVKNPNTPEEAPLRSPQEILAELVEAKGFIMLKGWMYILECSDGSYYTGSSNNMERRLVQHQNGEGAKYTKNKRPVKLVYCEELAKVDEAFYREKQVQGWSRAKKKALIDGRFDDLPTLSRASTSSATITTSVSELVEGKGLL